MPLQPRRRPTGERVVEYLVQVIVIAIFIVYVFPLFIGPQILGIDMSNPQFEFFYMILATAIAIPFAWAFAKLVSWNIRRSG